MAAERHPPWQVVEQRWADRHEREGQAVHDMLLDLSNMYVTSAQILASKGDFMVFAVLKCHGC